jgi:hypothetical protein
MLYDEKIIKTANRTIRKVLLVTTKLPIWNSSAGIAGTTNALVRNTAAIDGIPKTTAVLILTSPFLKYSQRCP